MGKNYKSMTKKELVELLEAHARQSSLILSPYDAYTHLEPYANESQEHFFSLVLNGSHKVAKTYFVTKGLANRTLVHPREVFRPAILDNAIAIIIAHNHPSGNLEPSSEDKQVTKSLSEAGELLGIKVLDHLIFGPTGWRSMKEEGDFPF